VLGSLLLFPGEEEGREEEEEEEEEESVRRIRERERKGW